MRRAALLLGLALALLAGFIAGRQLPGRPPGDYHCSFDRIQGTYLVTGANLAGRGELMIVRSLDGKRAMAFRRSTLKICRQVTP